MKTNFKDFELRLDEVYSKLPGSARREVLLARLYYHVFKLLDEQFSESLSEYGLTRTTFVALLLLYADPDNSVSPSTLSQVLVSSRTNITRVAVEMEANGWLQRRPDPEDRRRLQLSRTPPGKALLEELMPRQREYLRSLWSGPTEEEQTCLERLLLKLHDSLAPGDAEKGSAP